MAAVFFISFYKITGYCLCGARLVLVSGAREGTDWCHIAQANCVTQRDCVSSMFVQGEMQKRGQGWLPSCSSPCVKGVL